MMRCFSQRRGRSGCRALRQVSAAGACGALRSVDGPVEFTLKRLSVQPISVCLCGSKRCG